MNIFANGNTPKASVDSNGNIYSLEAQWLYLFTLLGSKTIQYEPKGYNSFQYIPDFKISDFHVPSLPDLKEPIYIEIKGAFNQFYGDKQRRDEEQVLTYIEKTKHKVLILDQVINATTQNSTLAFLNRALAICKTQIEGSQKGIHPFSFQFITNELKLALPVTDGKNLILFTETDDKKNVDWQKTFLAYKNAYYAYQFGQGEFVLDSAVFFYTRPHPQIPFFETEQEKIENAEINSIIQNLINHLKKKMRFYPVPPPRPEWHLPVIPEWVDEESNDFARPKNELEKAKKVNELNKELFGWECKKEDFKLMPNFKNK